MPEEKDSSSSQVEESFELVSLGNANESKKAKPLEENVQKNLCNVGPKDV